MTTTVDNEGGRLQSRFSKQSGTWSGHIQVAIPPSQGGRKSSVVHAWEVFVCCNRQARVWGAWSALQKHSEGSWPKHPCRRSAAQGSAEEREEGEFLQGPCH